jgi:hypothetical protein
MVGIGIGDHLPDGNRLVGAGGACKNQQADGHDET